MARDADPDGDPDAITAGAASPRDTVGPVDTVRRDPAPPRRTKLTETAIQAATRKAVATGKRDELADPACPSLRLRLEPSGTRSWCLACRDPDGRMRRFPLGSFHDLSISAARTEARALRVRIKAGADPIADKRRHRAMGDAAKAGLGTLTAVLDLYGNKRGASLKSWPEARKRINLVLKPLLGRPAASLAASEMQMIADGYASEVSASFVVRSVRPALKWAAERGLVAKELAGLRAPMPVRRRKRVLGRDELARLLPVLRTSARPYAPALCLMLLTLTRRQELASARWRDIDLVAGTWTIPETKNGEPHLIPLSRQALALVRALRPANALPDGLAFTASTGGKLVNWDRETKALMQASGTTGWTRHDLRRTGATLLGEMGELPHVIEAALNHAAIRSPIAATYNRSRYRPQVADALQRLADALDGIEAGAAIVTPMRAAG